jgi:hypothetical protein
MEVPVRVREVCPLLFVLGILAGAALVVEQASAQEAFPLERLGELERALTAARGDVSAVGSWRDEDVDLNVSGDVKLRYKVPMAGLEPFYRTLTDCAAIDWRDGVLASVDGKQVLLYKGMSIRRAASALELMGPFLVLSWATAGSRMSIRMSRTEIWEVEGGTITAFTPMGELVFEGFLQQLQSWTVRGPEVTVAVFEDDQLSLHAWGAPGASILTLNLEGVPYFNPLFCAVAYGRETMVSALLEAGASLQPEGPGTPTALHIAAGWWQQGSAQRLLDAGIDIDGTTGDGITSLDVAIDSHREEAFNQGEEMALFLLDKGADFKLRKPNGETVLFAAARRSALKVIDRLIADGLDPELADTKGETALFAAVRYNQPAALRCLVRHDVVWNGKNRRGESPMSVAKGLKLPECVAPLEWRQGFHWSSGLNLSLSSSSESGYGAAPGAGLFLDLHVRLSHRQWLTTEVGYTIRGTSAPASDAWLTQDGGSPYYEYQHMDISPRLNWALHEGATSRWFAIVGGEYRLQTAADIRTDSGMWEPADVSDKIESSGTALTYGVGFTRFTVKGALLGLELRRSTTLSGEWTSAGGGLNSWVLLFRFGS